MMPLVLALLAMVVGSTMALTVQSTSSVLSGTSLGMAPRFEDGRWIPSSPDEEASAGYDATGSLLRQGPGPYFQRIFKADDYDQAVLKFMAGEGCSRDEAQASMDGA